MLTATPLMRRLRQPPRPSHRSAIRKALLLGSQMFADKIVGVDKGLAVFFEDGSGLALLVDELDLQPLPLQIGDRTERVPRPGGL